MNINSLTTAQRETLILEVLKVLKTHIPNITRPSGVLLNQNQPIAIEEKGALYNVTAYVRAVDYSGKYIFLGPYYLKGKMKDGLWEISEPRFECGVDGCYYDVIGMRGSHLKFYQHMVTIDEDPVYFEECEGVTLVGDGESPSKVVYTKADGTVAEFNWDNSTQNLPFMENLIRISELMLDIAKKDKAKQEMMAKAKAMKQERSSDAPSRPGSAAPAATGAFAGRPAARPAARESSAPAPTGAFASRTTGAFANRPIGRPTDVLDEKPEEPVEDLKIDISAATSAGAYRMPPISGSTPSSAPSEPSSPSSYGGDKLPGSERPLGGSREPVRRPAAGADQGLRRTPSPFEQATSAPHAAPAEGPAIAQNYAQSGDPDSPFLPDTRVKRPEKEQKSPFVPLKDVPPEMEKPKPFDGPSILDTYVPEWTKDEDIVFADEGPKEIKPMTAESLSHIDDRKHVKSVVASPEEEVEKYRRLMLIGAITPDEFEVKKRQLIGKTNNPNSGN